MSVTSWSPTNILRTGRFALCILNQPVLNSDLLVRLWNKSQFRVTVDGGTSIWSNIVNNTSLQISTENPDLITGDFDSAHKVHVDHFRSLGTKVIETPDQNLTDFTKCLEQLGALTHDEPKMGTVDAVLVFVESSGRLDHIMANIQTLFLAQKFIDKAVLLISSCNITWLLSPGSHQIKVNDLIDHASHCGLIPMDGQVIATSKGLKWDIDGELKFGDVVSTSNGFLSDVITVSCDKPLLWTMDWNGDGVV